MKYFYNNEEIQAGVPFEKNGLAYPWNWFDLASKEDLRDHGFTVEVEPEVTPVPKTVTPRQARLALDAAGLLETVTQVVAVSPKAVQITWEFATEVNRDDPLINAMKNALGLSDTQLDKLFITAATL